jgi:hypothetical protein
MSKGILKRQESLETATASKPAKIHNIKILIIIIVTSTPESASKQ